MPVMTPVSPARPATRRKMPPESPSLAEERREVFESVLASLAHDPLDADRLAADRHLMRHLSRTAASARRTAVM